MLDSRDVLNFCGQLTENQFFDFKLNACFIYINADEIAFGIVIQDHAIRNLTTINAWLG